MFSGILEFFKKIWERNPFHGSLDVWNNSMLIDLSVIGYWILLLGLLLGLSIWFLSNKKHLVCWNPFPTIFLLFHL